MKKLRFFMAFTGAQQRWLNRMADDGWRLVRAGRMTYEFAPCRPGEYRYCVDFVAHKSAAEAERYRRFLEETGCRTWSGSANLNCSFLRRRWRPYGEGRGQLAARPGAYGREILIAERKNDGSPFELHTTNADRAAALRPLRNAWLSTAVLLLALALWSAPSGAGRAAAMAAAGAAAGIPAALYQRRISRLKASPEE